MEYSGQRHWHCQVTRPAGGPVRARTTYLSIDLEAMAVMTVDPATLEVEDARWTIHRRENGEPENRPVPALAGVCAYFGAGPALKKALAGLAPPAGELFAETVRGVIQAETFLTGERGFASLEDYDAYWRKQHLGSCRYYSNLDRVIRSWAVHISGQDRTDVLFNRFKSAVWHRLPAGGFLMAATLADSFHDAGLTVRTGPPGFTVVEAEGGVPRAPDAVCREAEATVAGLVGTDLARTDKRTVARILGGPQACVHLVDLAGDLCRGVAADLAGKTGGI